ncbi:condensation domain-containing protein [Streptomyces sp. BE147]|uniref:condensation domain-containing protein n=1 Tax=Streptomyces sp. BE147 TaxID=3002524 RepID=UPI002E76BFD7|nr:condensation domain-containing protein [Streptomyces sp. BE147]MEE1742430.1 condensation domain-containing protein [Streptomyces sp. BE147]
MRPTDGMSATADQVVVLSARTPGQLAASVGRLSGFLDRNPDTGLADLAFTLQAGQEAMGERYAVVVSSTEELRAALRAGRGHPATVGATRGLAAEIRDDSDLRDLLIRRWAATGELSRLAALWVSGIEVDWAVLHREAPRRVPDLGSVLSGTPGTAGGRWNLSSGQLTMYRDHRRWPEPITYNLPLLFEIHGDLDTAALERAVRAQTRIHPVLSAVFGERDGVPYMDIDPDRVPSFDRVGLGSTSRAGQLAELRALADVPFDLATGPLVRAHLVSLAGGRRLLLITVHHILLDGTSTALLIRTLKEAYRGRESAGRATYGDFVAWEEAMLAGPGADRHRDHWVRELAGTRKALALPYDRPYDPERMPRVEVVTMGLPPALVTALADRAREHRVSVAIVLFSTYVRFLHRLTGQDDLVTGLTAVARYEERFQDVVGQFVNCLPIRSTVAGGFPELLKAMQRKVIAGIDHGALPLPEIARALGAGGKPLVLTNFLFQNFDGADLLTNNSSAGPGELDLRRFGDLPYAGEFVLSVEFYREGDGYKVFLKYDAQVFDESTVRRMRDEWYSVMQEEAGMEQGPP